MIQSHEKFNNTFPFKPHFANISGFKMHYVDEGTGETVLCLHGEPTWSYLFRHLIESLKGQYRVIAPDHMGFGKSETPKDRTYWLQDHINNIEELVLTLDLRNITLVMHDFGGPVGMGLVSRQFDRIKRVIAVNAPTPFGQKDLFDRVSANAAKSPWFQWIVSAHQKSTLIPVLEQLHYNTLSTLKLNGFENNNLITETWLKAYSEPFREPTDCAGAIGWALGFASNMHQFEAPAAKAIESAQNLPAMAIWGKNDKTLHADEFLPLFRQTFPKAFVHLLEGVGHYSFEDAPQKISELITQFLEETAEHRHDHK